MVRRLFRLIQIALIFAGGICLALFLYNLQKYSRNLNYAHKDGARTVQFHYGSRIFYLTRDEARPLFVLFGTAAGCGVIAIVSGLVVGDLLSRKSKSGDDETS